MSFIWHDLYSSVSADSLRATAFLFFCARHCSQKPGLLWKHSSPSRPRPPLSTSVLSFLQVQLHFQSFGFLTLSSSPDRPGTCHSSGFTSLPIVDLGELLLQDQDFLEELSCEFPREPRRSCTRWLPAAPSCFFPDSRADPDTALRLPPHLLYPPPSHALFAKTATIPATPMSSLLPR